MHGSVNVNFFNIYYLLSETYAIQKYKGNTSGALLWQLFLYKLATSQEYHDVQIAVGTRVEPPQNCYIAQISGHTNYARLVRQPFPPNTGLRFSREMAVATIG